MGSLFGKTTEWKRSISALDFLAFNGFTAVLVLYFKQAFGWGPGLSAGAFLVVGLGVVVARSPRKLEVSRWSLRAPEA